MKQLPCVKSGAAKRLLQTTLCLAAGLLGGLIAIGGAAGEEPLPSTIPDLNAPYLRTLEDVANLPLDTTQIDHIATPREDLLPVLQALARLPKLRKLDLRQTPVTDEHLAALPELKALEMVLLRGQRGYGMNQVGPEGIAHIARCRRLRALHVGALQLNDQSLASIGQLDRLEVLMIDSNPQITGQGLRHLKGLTQLRQLNLYGCSGLTADDLVHLQSLRQLRHLTANDLSGLNDHNLAHLAALTELETLGLPESAPITDRGFATVAALPRLQKLELRGWRNVSDSGYVLLRNHPALRELHLHDAGRLGDRGLAAIGSIRGLRQLSLVGVGYASSAAGLHRTTETDLSTVAGIEQLGNLQQLERLTLWNLRHELVPALPTLGRLKRLRYLRTDSHLGAAWVGPLARLPELEEAVLNAGPNEVRALLATSQSLRHLTLDAADIDVATLTAIARMEQLRHLQLYSFEWREDYVPPLETMEQLETLIISSRKDVSQAATGRLRRALPQTELHLNHQRYPPSRQRTQP